MLKPSIRLNRIKDKYERDKNNLLAMIANDINEALEKNNVNISKLCRDLGINRTMFYYILSGERKANVNTLDKICNYLGLTR